MADNWRGTFPHSKARKTIFNNPCTDGGCDTVNPMVCKVLIDFRIGIICACFCVQRFCTCHDTHIFTAAGMNGLFHIGAGAMTGYVLRTVSGSQKVGVTGVAPPEGREQGFVGKQGCPGGIEECAMAGAQVSCAGIPKHQLPRIHTHHGAYDSPAVEQLSRRADFQIFQFTHNSFKPGLLHPLAVIEGVRRILNIIGVGDDMSRGTDLSFSVQSSKICHETLSL